MSISAVSSAGTESTSTEALRQFAFMPAMSGIGNPRMAPKTLALVIALHVVLLGALANYRTEATPPPPPVMVSLIAPEPAPEAPKPEITPPKPLPAVPKPVKKKAEPGPVQKPDPVVQPEPQLVSRAPESTPAPAAESPAPMPPAPAPEVAPPQPEVAQAAPPGPEEKDPPIDPPRFNADYLDNPAPGYPSLSRRMREEGRVLLRVHVAAGGTAKTVVLHQSSGHSRLDQVALDTVRRWRFVPARQGDKPVEAWVIVPIQFNLKG